MKDREKEKLGTKATLAALEIELQSSVQQVPPKLQISNQKSLGKSC